MYKRYLTSLRQLKTLFAKSEGSAQFVRICCFKKSTDYVSFRSFGIIGHIRSQSENRAPLKPVLRGC